MDLFDAKRLHETCSRIGFPDEEFGCMMVGEFSGICFVYVNKALDLLVQARVIRHELAHCHGWPADHP